jgi:hypothetical protein
MAKTGIEASRIEIGGCTQELTECPAQLAEADWAARCCLNVVEINKKKELGLRRCVS